MKLQYKALIMTLMMIGLPSLFILPALTNSLVLADFDDEPDQLSGTGPTPTPTFCPRATSEPLWVDPVVSPTGILTQTVVIHIGNGEWAGVTLETGEFTQTGDFGSYSNPAAIQIDLLPNWTHHLTAAARVKVVENGGCQYGGYTLTTTHDREGNPLTIIHSSNLTYLYLPIIVYGTEESPLPTTPPPSITEPPPNFDPSYPTVCIPPPPPDLDCPDIPYRNFQVLPPDPHRFDGDGDGDGIGRESGK